LKPSGKELGHEEVGAETTRRPDLPAETVLRCSVRGIHRRHHRARVPTDGGRPAIHLPIFEGGQLKASYKGAVADIDLSIANYNHLIVKS
jgi:hypothetical protein